MAFDVACLSSAVPVVVCATNTNVGEEIEQASFVRCSRGVGAVVFIRRQGPGGARRRRSQGRRRAPQSLATQETLLRQADARPLGRGLQDVRKLLIGNSNAGGRRWRRLLSFAAGPNPRGAEATRRPASAREAASSPAARQRAGARRRLPGNPPRYRSRSPRPGN